MSLEGGPARDGGSVVWGELKKEDQNSAQEMSASRSAPHLGQLALSYHVVGGWASEGEPVVVQVIPMLLGLGEISMKFQAHQHCLLNQFTPRPHH